MHNMDINIERCPVVTNQGKNIITEIMITFGERTFRGTLEECTLNIAIIYNIRQCKQFESLALQKGAVTNIRKYQIYSRFVRLDKLAMWHRLCANVRTNFAVKRRRLGRYISLANSGQGV
jgi:hypothetical protein